MFFAKPFKKALRQHRLGRAYQLPANHHHPVVTMKMISYGFVVGEGGGGGVGEGVCYLVHFHQQNKAGNSKVHIC